MPFFLPDELVGLRYLSAGGDVPDKAGNYRHEIDLAFFVVNFGYSKSEYMELTPRERAFIYRAWEDKVVRDSQLVHDASFLAQINANRKRGRSMKPLWTKRGTVNPEEMQRLVQQEKKKKPKSILDRIRRR